MVGRTVGNYRIVAELGAGGMGIVYKAWDVRLDRFLALKFLKPERITDEFRRRFLQEARASSALHHPNIVHIYDIGDFEGHDYIAMEFVDGLSLREILRNRRVEVSEAVRYSIQIAEAMAAAHKAGIVHRDLKPGNLMITPQGLVKILDFGLAKLASQAQPSAPAAEPSVPLLDDPDSTLSVHTITTDRTQVGVAVGSPAFMSPEQAMGRPVDGRSDIFSFGSIIYEMLTGRRAFLGEKSVDVIGRVIRENPPPPGSLNANVNPEVDALVMRAIRKDPAERFQSMDELKTELEALQDGSSTHFLAASPALARTRRRTALIAAAVAIVVIAPLVYLASRNRATLVPDAPLQAKRLTLDAGLNIDPAISPDGKFVAYASDRAGEGHLDIWLRQIGAGGDPIRLTRDQAEEREPVFSPDGTRIAFRSERDGGGIYIMPALGGEPRMIIREGRRPRFSPDGNQIAYWKGLADPFPLRPGNSAAFVYDLATNQTRQVAPEFQAAADPVFSPDGAHIVFIGLKDAANIPKTFNWWVVAANGGPAVMCPLNTIYLRVPFSWRGDRIFFESGGHQFGAKIGQVRVDPKTFQPVGQPANLTVGTTDEFSPSISRDGRVVFSGETRSTNLYSLPLDTNQGKVLRAPQPLSHDLGENSVRSVSADGKRVVFLSRRPPDDPAQVWGLDLESGREHVLTSGGRDKHMPEISPDGSVVAWRENSTNVTEIFLTPFEGGAATKLCGDCQGQAVWSPAGDFVLVARASERGTIDIVERETGRRTSYMRSPQGADLRARALSADGKWLAFTINRTVSSYTIYVAPFRPNSPPPAGEWIDVAFAADAQPFPRWSPDAGMLYFGSIRDGFACLWAQRLNRKTKRPEGAAFPIQHFHLPTLALESPSFNYPFALGPNAAILSLAERSGGLWVLEYALTK